MRSRYLELKKRHEEREEFHKKEKARMRHIIRTQKSKIESLQEVIADLETQKTLAANERKEITAMTLGPNEELSKKLMKKDFRPQKYEEDVIQFTKTLRSYSPKAYEYLRNYLALPSKATLNNHNRSSKCLPDGMKNQSVDEPEAQAESETHKKDPICQNASLDIDGMSIEELIEYTDMQENSAT